MSPSSSRHGIRFSRALQKALTWLAAPPASDPLRDLTPLRRHLAGIATLGIAPLQYAKILGLFHIRAELAGRAAPAQVELPASDWMIINESPSGYAIMHVAGALA